MQLLTSEFIDQKQILLVTHGAFLHYFTQSWDGISPDRGSAYKNCEVRQFTFSEESSVEKAELVETAWSRERREVAEEIEGNGDVEVSAANGVVVGEGSDVGGIGGDGGKVRSAL